MKLPAMVAAATATTTAFALPAAEASSNANDALSKRGGPSLSTYAVSGFRIAAVSASIRPYSLFSASATSSVKFIAQPLDANGLALGQVASCAKTWTDSVFKRSTASVSVACSNPDVTFYTSRNLFRFWEFDVDLAYKLSNTAGKTNSTSALNGTSTVKPEAKPGAKLYGAKFALNERSSPYKCVKDKAQVQNCVSNGGTFLTSTLSEKKLS